MDSLGYEYLDNWRDGDGDRTIEADFLTERLLTSHAVSPELLRSDSFEEFLADRRRRMVALVERAMGKSVSQVTDEGVYEEADGA